MKLLSGLIIFVMLSIPSSAQEKREGSSTREITVQDPAEYNAFYKAVQMPPSAMKTLALEQFLEQFPKSVLKAEALRAEFYDYQSAKNEDDSVRTAERLVEIEPEDLRMIAYLAYTYRQCGNRNGANASMCAQNATQWGRTGLDVLAKVRTPPAGMSLEEFDTLKTQVRPIFEEAAGMKQPRSKNKKQRSQR